MSAPRDTSDQQAHGEDRVEAEYVDFSPSKAVVRPPRGPLSWTIFTPEEPDEVIKSVYNVASDKFTCWRDFCSWCLMSVRADHTLVAELSGRVLASDGDLSRGDAEELARWAVTAVTEARLPTKAAGTLSSLTAELAAGWVTALPILAGADGDGVPYVIGLFSSKPLFHDVRRAVINQALFTTQNLE